MLSFACSSHALLSLYSSIDQSQTYWPVKKRNEFLVQFIKSKIKQPQYSKCKKELKTMLSIGRNAKGNLETKLWQMNEINLSYQAKFTYSDELYIMLTDLFELHRFASMLENETQEREMDTLYMKSEQIEKRFDDNGKQVKPLSMKVKTHRLNTLIDKVQGTGAYRVEVEHIDDHDVIHLLLHRTKK